MKKCIVILLLIVCTLVMPSCSMSGLNIACNQVLCNTKSIDIISSTLKDIQDLCDDSWTYNIENEEYVFGENDISVCYYGAYSDGAVWDGKTDMPPYDLINGLSIVICSNRFKTFQNISVGDTITNFNDRLNSYSSYLVRDKQKIKNSYNVLCDAYIAFDRNLAPMLPDDELINCCVFISYKFEDGILSRIVLTYHSPYDYDESITEPLNLALSKSN